MWLPVHPWFYKRVVYADVQAFMHEWMASYKLPWMAS